jgi:hypothetical protein
MIIALQNFTQAVQVEFICLGYSHNRVQRRIFGLKRDEVMGE